MKKFLLASFLIGLIFCGTAVIIWTLPKILPLTVREAEIHPINLLVSLDDFPKGWQERGIPEPEPDKFELDWGEENIFVRFQPNDKQGFATHYIFKFRNKAASNYGLFRIKQQGFLFPASRKPPEGWKYRSLSADDWSFGCTDEKVCTAIGRYDEFISVFITSIDPNYMTLDDLESVLETIDEKISENLEISPK
jgi:hypothetical protein